MNASPVLLRFNMPGPFCTAYIIKCIAMQKRPGLGCRGYWPLSPSISVLNTSLCRIWSKTVQNRNPIPVQIRFKMPGPFCMGGPFCTVGSCRTVRVWVVVYNLDCVFQNRYLTGVSIGLGPNQFKISMLIPIYYDFRCPDRSVRLILSNV